MLLKTIAEVKAVLRISNLDDDSTLPDIESAEQTYIIPAIGQDLYDALNAGYNADPVDLVQIEMDLLKKIQKPLAAFAYLDDIGIIHAQITNAGIRRTSTDNMPSAFRWEVDGVKDALANRAYQGMESLLQYLEKYKDQFPDWTNSNAYKRRTAYLIKSGYDFSDNFNLYQPLRTYNALYGIMGDVEELYIIPAIGKTFFDELKALTNPDTNQVRVIADLKKAIAHLCIRHACEKLPVRISDAGFTVNTAIGSNDTANANRENVPNTNLSLLVSSCDRDGKNYLLKAKSFLDANAAAGIFATYFNSPLYTAPADPNAPIDDPNSRRKIFTL